MKTNDWGNVIFMIVAVIALSVSTVTSAVVAKDEVDKVIEEEITQKLTEDLLQSVERKFQVDLEKSVDAVLSKIKLLLQNGTSHIQERLSELQSLVYLMKKNSGNMVDVCLLKRQNETTALAEKALHQMVVCGYALIGHDPAQAVKSVLALKEGIKQGIKPMQEPGQKSEINNLLKVCGHDHDTLKKVIKCVISKSPQLKSAMMAISSKLVDGVVRLTKQMAHGAMHEACLIEVIKTVEDEAFGLIKKVKRCAYNETEDNTIADDLDHFLKQNNATLLDIMTPVKRTDDKDQEDQGIKKREKEANEKDQETNKKDSETNDDVKTKEKEVEEMKVLLRRMLKDTKKEDIDERFKDKIKQLKTDLAMNDENKV